MRDLTQARGPLGAGTQAALGRYGTEAAPGDRGPLGGRRKKSEAEVSAPDPSSDNRTRHRRPPWRLRAASLRRVRREPARKDGLGMGVFLESRRSRRLLVPEQIPKIATFHAGGLKALMVICFQYAHEDMPGIQLMVIVTSIRRQVIAAPVDHVVA